MPIYQYQCSDCGHGLEALQKMSDSRLVDCPECEAPSLKKQVTAAAFKLKGTGWYETDFKNSGKKPEPAKADAGAKAEKSGESNSASKSESKTDTKTAVAAAD